MRFDLFLNVKSAANSIDFYVHELKLFTLDIDYGNNDFLLCAAGSKQACLSISEAAVLPRPTPIFGLAVESCDKEFERIIGINLSNGARIVPSRNSLLEVTEFPTGKSFAIADPSGHQFVLFENYIQGR
jgi:hypothetical protein